LKVLTFCLILLATTAVFPQGANSSGNIYGKVLQAGGEPLSGVRVRLESGIDPPASATTSAGGNFRFVNLPPGNYELLFFLQGYAPVKRKDITVTAGERVQLNVTLEPTSINNGVIYGTVTDLNGIALEGVRVTLKSDTIPQLEAATAADGSFRFEGLPAGKYLVVVKQKGYLEFKQEQIDLSVGDSLQINVQLMPKAPKGKAAGTIQRSSTGISWTYSRDDLRLMPNSQSIYAILDHTLAVDADTISTVQSDPAGGRFATVVARGSDNTSIVWNYDGLNITVPDFPIPFSDFYAQPSFFDLENAEEVQIITAGNDVSIPTGGVTVNIISRRGTTRWHVDAYTYISDSDLQSSNTPQEIIDDPRYTLPLISRLDSLQDYGFNLGGPVIPDRLFVWGAYHHGRLDRFNGFDEPEAIASTAYSLKANLNLSTAHQLQFGYFRADQHGLLFIEDFDGVIQAELERTPRTFLPGIWTAQYNWIPDDNTTLKARYGYNGTAHIEGYLFLDEPDVQAFSTRIFEQAGHNAGVEIDRFAENLFGGDHEFRFGFEYKTSNFNDFTFDTYTYLNESTLRSVLLTEGTIEFFYSNVPIESKIARTSLYAGDTYRKGRLTLDLALRYDRQTGKNDPRTYASPLDDGIPDFLGPGFEELIPTLTYPGKDPGIIYDNLSPRIGATYDLRGNGSMLAYGRFARYYQPYDRSLLKFSELSDPPVFSANYVDRNEDGVITLDEIGNPNLIRYNDALSQRLYDSQLSNSYVNEFVIGIQTRLHDEWSISAAVTHRSYHVFHIAPPFDLTPDAFQPNGTAEFHTPLGDFVVPLFSFPDFADFGTGILRNNNDYTQSYDSLDLMLEKAMANNFMLSGGVVFQRQRGHNYSEDFPPFLFLHPTGSVSFVIPGINYGVLENHPYFVFSKGLFLYSGWQLKFGGAYRFPLDIGVGAFLRYQQGYPYVLLALVPFFTSFVEPVGERRHDNVFTLDLKLNKEFRLQNYGSIDLILEILNVTNANTVIARNGFLGVFADDAFQPNQDLGTILQFQPPRVLRLGVRYTF